ncbi:MAG: SH3 domain-containing protein [Lentisphaeria bacterium]|nr:SH3 domain-containing protein [Lentisphaeria bacterium]
MKSADDLIRVAPNYLGVSYNHLDCQAFVERCLRDIGIDKDLPGSNAWFREVMNHGWVGSPEECKQKYGLIPPGAFLFILEHDGKEPEKYKPDGIGNASHIGIYTGMSGEEMCKIGAQPEKYDFGDGAIHSSASRGFVCTSNFKGKSISGGWNRVGLWDQIDYDGGGKVEPYKAKVIDGNLNLREAPSKSAPRIIQIPDGSIVTVLDESGGWSKVEYSAFTGYAMSEFLERVDSAKDEVSVPRDDLQAMYDIIGEWLGLRG